MKKSKVFIGLTVGALSAGLILLSFTGCSGTSKTARISEDVAEEICEIEDETLPDDGNSTDLADVNIIEEKEDNCAVFGSKQIVVPKVKNDEIEIVNTFVDNAESSNEETPAKSGSKEESKTENNNSNAPESIAKINNSQSYTATENTNLETQKAFEPVSIPEPQIESKEVKTPEQPKGHYEERWIVDCPEKVIEEPIYTEESRSICNGCGADITGGVDSHMAEHFVAEGIAPSYRGENITHTEMQTKVIPEQGHYEQVWVND